MSREFTDPDETADDQTELAFAPARTAGAAREVEPPRAEFFRPQRRPILPIVGLVGAVATVAAFLWLGRDEPQPPAAEATPPVASAPSFEVPLPEAPPPAPSPSSVAAIDAPAPPAEVDPLAPNPSALGPSAALPPVAAAAALPEPIPAVPPSAAAGRPSAAPAAVARPSAAPAAHAAAPAHKKAAATHGGYAVQLLAGRSESQVDGAWKKLRGAHPDLLASLSPSVSATGRTGSGRFYRLRAGPLHDRAAADALCRQLSARHQSCFVVSPGS